jgi:hypothetical protein
MTASRKGRHDVRIEMRIPAIRKVRSFEKSAMQPMAISVAARRSAARAFLDRFMRVR